MLGRFRRNRATSSSSQVKNGPVQPDALPPGLRVYAVGDIHGRLDLLQRLEAMICADMAAGAQGLDTAVVYLGDYVDRGPDSYGVIQHLLTRPRFAGRDVFLRGNHEDVMLQFLGNPRIGDNWFAFGGIPTLISYGVKDVPSRAAAGKLDALRDDFVTALPPAHAAFLQNLAMGWEAGDYFFAHAGIDPARPIDAQEAQSLMWIREAFTDFEGVLPRRVVHGHTITDEVEVFDNRIGIDTGAYATGLLSCAVIEGRDVRILDTARG